MLLTRWVRVAALSCGVLVLACEGGVPSVSLDGGGVPAREPDSAAGAGVVARADESTGSLAAAGVPSDGWTSPPACAPVSSPAYCSDCWSWTDGGAWSLGRNEVSDRFGVALTAGDFNGDEYPDLAVGAPGEDDQEVNEGAVYVFLGSERGYQPWRVLRADDLGVLPATDLGVGTGLAALDFDVDGFSDLVVAFDAPTGGQEGRIAVIFGRADGFAGPKVLKLSQLDPSGSTASISLGEVMATGDYDGDGDDDLAVGAPNYQMGGANDAGAVLIVVGGEGPNPGPRVDLDAAGYGASDNHFFGSSLATFRRGAGLADELYIGAPGVEGVFRYDGTYFGPWYSSIGISGFGRRIAVGDLTKDGLAEVVVSGDDGDVMEVMGYGDLIYSPDPRGAADVWPMAVADFDDDGLEDLAFASVPKDVPGWDSAIYIAPGTGSTSPGTPIELVLPAREVWDDLGRAAIVGDMDGDWQSELIVGAAVQDSSGSGRVYAFLDGGIPDWSIGKADVVDQETELDGCDVCAVHEWSDGTICDGGSGALICVDQSCVTRRCGDGYRQTAAGPWTREACDDGNNLDGDLCSATCGASSYTVATTGDDRNTPYGPRYTAGVDGTGAFLITWKAPTAVVGRLGDYEIRGQRFTRRGVPDGAELVLSSPLTLGIDPTPSVAGLASGGWVVTWSEPGGDDSMAGVVFRIVEPDGSMHGVEVAASETYLDQLAPSVAALDSGFVITWTDTSLSLLTGPARRVVARRFFESGRPDGEDFVVSTEPEREHAESVVTGSGDTFLIAWVDRGGAVTDETDVRARRFDASGPVDEADLVLEDTRASEVSVATLDTGDFVAAWGDIHARRIASSGTPLLETAEVLASSMGSSPFTSQYAPSVAALPSGHYAVIHQVYRDERGLGFARSPGASEPTDLSILLGHLGEQGGDASLLATPRGVLAVWSNDSIAGAWRSTFTYLLAVD